MNQIELAPYIFFKGNAKEAFEFYKSVFGGELKTQSLGEVPAEVAKEMKLNESRKDELMHARLDGGLVVLMGSDSQAASDHTAKVELSLSGTDEPKLREVFDKLASGGKITMPLDKPFWGGLFGMVQDKFGVDWMVNISAA